jgi:hypothetical protein
MIDQNYIYLIDFFLNTFFAAFASIALLNAEAAILGIIQFVFGVSAASMDKTLLFDLLPQPTC